MFMCNLSIDMSHVHACAGIQPSPARSQARPHCAPDGSFEERTFIGRESALPALPDPQLVCSGGVSALLAAVGEQPVAQRRQRESRVARLRDALDGRPAAADAVQADGPRGESLEEAIAHTVNEHRQGLQPERGRGCARDGAALVEAAVAADRVGGAGAARRVDRPFVGGVRLRDVDEHHGGAPRKLGVQRRERGREAPQRRSGPRA
mmetsp:Transcript_29674/g.81535  ORF Transcript_29674/g.81535 Transcript_29674/m.81535 type:complete len:207 (-) Transcript_29674:1121-1741(-)